MEKKTNKQNKNAPTILASAPTRGRIFEGTVIKKFSTRVVIQFERTIFIKKYERFYKKTSKMHARLPTGLDIQIGDYVRVRECRPLSKIIHSIVIEKVRSAESGVKK